MSVTSALLDRLSIAMKAGFQFGGKRDLYTVLGYTTNLTYQHYYAKYRRQDVAKRIVNAPAQATWRNPPEISGNKGFVKQWEALTIQHSIWSKIERADKLAGIGQFSILLIGLDDGKSLESPITGNDNKLIYLQPYAQSSAKILEFEQDISSPDFGMPKYYELYINNPGDDIAQEMQVKTVPDKQKNKRKVHASRIVHIAEEVLENNFFGTPRLEPVYNLMDDLAKVCGGTAESFWLIANRGMQADVDKDAELSEADAAALSTELEEYQHQLRRWIRTKGVKINPLGSETPDPKNTFDMIMSLISGTTGIPKRILLGSEAGQLASDQDRANWSDRIKERRTTFAEPGILMPLLKRLIAAGVLPNVAVEKLTYEWPQNFQLTPLEEAQMMAQKARAAINISKHYKEEPLMTKSEARVMIGLTEELPKGIEDFDPNSVEDNNPTMNPDNGNQPGNDSQPQQDPPSNGDQTQQ